MKAVFMGTPGIAVPSLEVLIEDKDIEVIGVFTQPDRKKGRGKKVSMPIIKEKALEHDIQVYQPQKIKEDEYVKILKELNPDIIIVTAYGQILSKEILDIPKFGCINVHASLLPELRGAAPINFAIINGLKKTGITTMYMDVGLDTGDMILKEEIIIDEYETAGSLHDKMLDVSRNVLKDTLKLVKSGEVKRIKQNDADATYAPIMDKTLGNINWSKSCLEIKNLINGINPWPCAYTLYKGEKVKIKKIKMTELNSTKEEGLIEKITQDGIYVNTQDKLLLIEEIQFPNKKMMPVKEYIKGNTIDIVKLGE
ncbi:MAG: methionyl-tRNA formyltransferase [Peptostreptococcaceae bacterium]|nr:methionyl-tRNA formyltransferase [Peptostreptococcaceae bacterium]